MSSSTTRRSKLALVGDVLFQGSIGRRDFPHGNQQELIDSITQRLWPMGDDTAFVPGHGPMSTFGHERATNPFVGDAAWLLDARPRHGLRFARLCAIGTRVRDDPAAAAGLPLSKPLKRGEGRR